MGFALSMTNTPMPNLTQDTPSDTPGAPDLAATLRRLDALTNWELRPRGGMRVELDPMLDLMARLGDPHRAFRSLHVAGTKGKGSVCALLEAALLAAGWRVGRYASPHVERVTERISIMGQEAQECGLSRAITLALDAYEAATAAGTPGAQASWFDILTAAAFLMFKEAKLDWAVVEVGLGGRLDSTNVVASEIAVVTNIELEHTEVLGHTRAAIAREKAGILKAGTTLVTPLAADDEAGQVMVETAARLGATLLRASLPKEASIEAQNAALAGLVLDRLGELGLTTRRADAVPRSIGAWLLDATTLAAARLPGRAERFDIPWPGVERTVGSSARLLPVVLDGAHVPFNLETVLRDLRLQPDLKGACVAVIGFAADKDAKGLIEVLGRQAAVAICTEMPGGRGHKAAELAGIAASLGLSSEVETEPRLALERGITLAATLGSFLLVTGSLHLVGALRPLVRGRLSAP
ncbi:dihydrofolate synthase / folylpolyglutamate synthase [Rhizobiales bacterium GAS188]|nr:dihydrofolate synthase / folylpolyglutamate synthase [Rhizobiales bacterium GAS188]